MLAGLCGGAADTLAWQCYQPITTQKVAGSAHDAVCSLGWPIATQLAEE